MNKTQLVDALAERIGDRHTAASAVEGLLETIVDTVRSGESVTLTGFGVFESRARAARVARNPRTGESVDVPATTVPAFRPGAGFRSAVGGGAPGSEAPADEPVSAPVDDMAPAEKAAAEKAPRAARKTSKAKAAPTSAADAPVAIAEKPVKGTRAAKAKAPAKAEAPAKAVKGKKTTRTKK